MISETEKIIIKLENQDGATLYLYEGYNNDISVTSDPQKAKAFDSDEPQKVLDFIERALRRDSIKKYSMWPIEPVRRTVTVERFVSDDDDWLRCVRNHAIGKLAGYEIRALGIDQYAVLKRCSD